MPDIDAKHFRTVLGNFPTGVTVVTAAPDGKPAGFTVGSFTSVSLDPAMVAFLPDKSSDTWPAIERHGSFCVNVLSELQQDLSNRFASKDDDKFDGVAWSPASTGAPLLDGCLAWMDCDIEHIYEGGDHWIVVGRVLELEVSDGVDAGPLLFFQGGYGQFTGS